MTPGAPGDRSGLARRLDRELSRSGAAALVVVASEPGDPDLAPFAGSARLGEAFVVQPRGDAPRLGYWTPMEREEAAATGLELLSPEALELAMLARQHRGDGPLLAAVLSAALERCGVAPGRLAIAGRSSAGALAEALTRLAEAGWSFVSGEAAMRRARRCKSAAEIAELRGTAAATCDAFRDLARRLAGASVSSDGSLLSEGEPLTVGSLKRRLAVAFAAAGLSQPRAPIVAPAEEGGVPHNAGSAGRALRCGEALVVDLFPKARLFSDCTRTFCVGTPPEALARAHADVAAALALAHRGVRPGVRGWELQRAVCSRLAEGGWPTPIDAPGTLRGYVHNLGHGVGYELHELPSFRDAADPEDGTLDVGDLVTLEPGLYEPGSGGFGVRLEDLVLVTAGGSENLTPLPLELDPRAW